MSEKSYMYICGDCTSEFRRALLKVSVKKCDNKIIKFYMTFLL